MQFREERKRRLNESKDILWQCRVMYELRNHLFLLLCQISSFYEKLHHIIYEAL